MNAAQKKFNFFAIEYPLYFAIVITVATVAFFVMLADNFKSYESNLEILFIPKSEKTAVQAELIAKNMSLLLKNLSFYEKMLRDNPRLEDKFAGMEKDAKKKAWGEMISVRVREKSTMITVKATSLGAEKTAELARQIAYTLFDSYAQYYSVKDDIDLRIVDGPIIRAQYQWLALALSSIFLGLIFSCIIYSAIFNVILEYAKVPSMSKLNFRFPAMPLRKIIPYTKDFGIKNRINKFCGFNGNHPSPSSQKERFGAGVNFEVRFKKAEAPGNLPTAKKDFSRVPGNLPVADSIPNNLPIAPSNLPIVSQEEPVIEIIPPVQEEPEEKGEPSKEEYKRRLNQLLRGEL